MALKKPDTSPALGTVKNADGERTPTVKTTKRWDNATKAKLKGKSTS
jgi:hypothetical protein